MISSMRIVALLLAVQNFVNAFAPQHNKSPLPSSSLASSTSSDNEARISSRRNFINTISSAAVLSTITSASPAYADEEEAEVVKTVQTPLYYILRVREATEQESRLIKSGKFKDVQRANVKLAVKFMVDNYRLNDNFIAASAYLEGDKRLKAGDVGTNVVQNLNTILEYFDSSDVQNIKVTSSGLGGKEKIVLDGLTAAKRGIDDFLSYFNKDDVLAVVAKIESENALNENEFDKALNQGDGILNPKPNQS